VFSMTISLERVFPRKNPNISGEAGGTRLTFVSQSG
jgi:hypothetical protein